jgi:hypothetical protein
MPYTNSERQKEALREHYQNNKEKYYAASKAARQRKFERMAELKSGPCTDCGVSYPPYVMQWDHIGTDKVANVSKLMITKGWQTVLAEVAKCELVCANCHMERTHLRQTGHV